MKREGIHSENRPTRRALAPRPRTEFIHKIIRCRKTLEREATEMTPQATDDLR